MSSIELTGYYNIVNRFGYAINASSVIIEQYSDVTSEIKEGLSIANNEEINIMFLSRVKLPIVEEVRFSRMSIEIVSSKNAICF